MLNWYFIYLPAISVVLQQKYDIGSLDVNRCILHMKN